MERNLRRFAKDMDLAIRQYGSNKVSWAKDVSWIHVKDFQLPDNFRQSRTDILILVPDNYGYGGCYRDNFIETDLELLDRDGHSYRMLSSDIHGFREYPYSSMSESMKKILRDRGWFYLCLHDKNPESSLVNYLYKVRLYLGNPYKDWKAIEQYGKGGR
jgi:hypothetical protein